VVQAGHAGHRAAADQAAGCRGLAPGNRAGAGKACPGGPGFSRLPSAGLVPEHSSGSPGNPDVRGKACHG
jgi:hypothetical protein